MNSDEMNWSNGKCIESTDYGWAWSKKFSDCIGPSSVIFTDHESWTLHLMDQSVVQAVRAPHIPEVGSGGI